MFIQIPGLGGLRRNSERAWASHLSKKHSDDQVSQSEIAGQARITQLANINSTTNEKSSYK